MRVLFAHGLESGPEGRKTSWLRGAGHDVRAPDCRGLELGLRIEILIAALADEAEPRVLVGSSFGGIAGLVAAIFAARAGHGPRALLLCAPALQLVLPARFATPLVPPCPAAVVHGRRDEIIPVEVGRRWAMQHGAAWFECDDDHSLTASAEIVLDALAKLVPED